ncbi:hypothetical protein [Kordiimonas sp.]
MNHINIWVRVFVSGMGAIYLVSMYLIPALQAVVGHATVLDAWEYYQGVLHDWQTLNGSLIALAGAGFALVATKMSLHNDFIKNQVDRERKKEEQLLKASAILLAMVDQYEFLLDKRSNAGNRVPLEPLYIWRENTGLFIDAFGVQNYSSIRAGVKDIETALNPDAGNKITYAAALEITKLFQNYAQQTSSTRRAGVFHLSWRDPSFS